MARNTQKIKHLDHGDVIQVLSLQEKNRCYFKVVDIDVSVGYVGFSNCVLAEVLCRKQPSEREGRCWSRVGAHLWKRSAGLGRFQNRQMPAFAADRSQPEV